MAIASNIRKIRQRIEQACLKIDRDPKSVKLIAVSKTVGADKIRETIAAGITIVGENRVQEAWRKFQEIESEVEWHLIGHLQTNKVKRALQFANVIHSVDSLRLAQEIQELRKISMCLCK